MSNYTEKFFESQQKFSLLLKTFSDFVKVFSINVPEIERGGIFINQVQAV